MTKDDALEVGVALILRHFLLPYMKSERDRKVRWAKTIKGSDEADAFYKFERRLAKEVIEVLTDAS